MIQHRQWSPEQIAETLKLDYLGDPDIEAAMKPFIGIFMGYLIMSLENYLLAILDSPMLNVDDVEQRVIFQQFKSLIHKKFISYPKKLKPEQ